MQLTHSRWGPGDRDKEAAGERQRPTRVTNIIKEGGHRSHPSDLQIALCETKYVDFSFKGWTVEKLGFWQLAWLQNLATQSKIKKVFHFLTYVLPQFYDFKSLQFTTGFYSTNPDWTRFTDQVWRGPVHNCCLKGLQCKGKCKAWLPLHWQSLLGNAPPTSIYFSNRRYGFIKQFAC